MYKMYVTIINIKLLKSLDKIQSKFNVKFGLGAGIVYKKMNNISSGENLVRSN